ARLIDAAADRIGDQLLMTLAPCLAVVDLGQQIAIGIEGIRIDAGECSHPATGGPGTRTLAVGYRDTLAAFDQRPDLPARDDDRLKWLHAASLPALQGRAQGAGAVADDAIGAPAMQLPCERRVVDRVHCQIIS